MGFSRREKRRDLGMESSVGALEARICKQMAGVGGEGPEGLKKIYESLSIGFQMNRAIRIEHIMMKRGLFGGFGLGVEEVRGLG
jgi:hypothetical protein